MAKWKLEMASRRKVMVPSCTKYTDGILEGRLPVEDGATVHGREIEFQT